MSGPGDIDGEVSGEEAAWRDLVARFDAPCDTDVADAPWPAEEDLPESDTAAAELPATQGEPGTQADDAVGPLDRTRVIRPATDPRSWSPTDEDDEDEGQEEDEPYVPRRLPPATRMDAVTKGAWVALVCGPGYLLLGTLAGWTISGTEALAAIAAFIVGFIVLVIKMGDRPKRDDNDDGAVL
jgi:hypothetical protein